MTLNDARIALEIFIERIEIDPTTAKGTLNGVITAKEIEALHLALQVMGNSPALEQIGVSPTSKDLETSAEANIAEEPSEELEEAAAVEARDLILDSIELDDVEDPGVLLCLDFGTATSKAIATENSDSNLIELAVGKQAGQEQPIFALESSLFITKAGVIYFGGKAITESLGNNPEQHARLDSIKDYICKGAVGENLDSSSVEARYNPSSTDFTKSDIVTLFLAYFTDMAVTELQDKGHSRYVRRRFTLPILPDGNRADWAKDRLSELLARAQILADTLHGSWADGIDAKEAKALLNSIQLLEKLPRFLVEDGITEPVAAIASRTRNLVCQKYVRRLIMIVDVGAGTIDFTLFAEVEIPGQAPKLFRVPGTEVVLRQAGDFVDKLLSLAILEDAGVNGTDRDYGLINTELSLRIRQLKEELFNEGILQYSLSNDATGIIDIDDFLQNERVKRFQDQIKEQFVDCFNKASSSYRLGLGRDAGGLGVILTGGGAGLPMLSNLKDASLDEVRFGVSGAIPRWVEENHPDLVHEYPRLAVAIGGASRVMPELAPEEFGEFAGAGERGTGEWEVDGFR